MNIPGVKNYSSATVGLRQADKITDMHLKLIYIFPVLFSDDIKQDLHLSFRTFITLSFLREIIITDCINVVSSASSIPNVYQNPQTNIAQIIGNAVLSGSGGGTTPLPQNQGASPYYNPSDFQQRVHRSLEKIKRYLEVDNRTKKLNPIIKMVTTDNHIEVPVIVGTLDKSASAYIMLFVLAIAINTSQPLNKIENVEKIVFKLRNTRQDLWIHMLQNLTKNNPTFFQLLEKKHPSIAGFLEKVVGNPIEKAVINPAKNLFSTLKSSGRSIIGERGPRFNQLTTSKQETRNLTTTNPTLQNKAEVNKFFDVLNLNKNNLDDFLLNYRFVLDPDLLRNQTGLKFDNNTMDQTVIKLSSQQKQIFYDMHQKFMELLATPGTLFLVSVFNTLYPTQSDDPIRLPHAIPPGGGDSGITGYYGSVLANPSLSGNTSINFLELKDRFIDTQLNKNIQTLINDVFATEITNSLSSISPIETSERVNLLKSMCESMANVDNILTDSIRKYIPFNLPSVNFNASQFDNFSSSVHEISGVFSSLNKKFENVFGMLVNNGNVLLSRVHSTIYSSIESFIRDIIKRPNYISAAELNVGVHPDKILKVYVPGITDILFTIVYFFFLYRLQAAICSYVKILDTEIESKVNDIFDFPNYTLISSVDIVLGVYTAYMSKHTQDIIYNDINDTEQRYNIGNLRNYNDNYIQGIVKVLTKELKIPNIIIIDEKKQEFFYKFMYMSSVKKMSMSTLKSFIQSSENEDF